MAAHIPGIILIAQQKFLFREPEAVPAVNADGTEITLTIPEYVSGRIRIMAVGSSAAQGATSTAGNAQASTEVRGTLILKPLLPLAVAPGDEFDGALVCKYRRRQW